MKQKSEILDFDAYLDSPELYAYQKSIDDELDSIEADKKRYKKRTKPDKSDTDSKRGNKAVLKEKDKFELRNAGTALEGNARTKLEYYLKKSPQYKVLDEQISLLLEEYKNYKKIGNKELMTVTQELIIDLQSNKKKIVKIYKKENSNKITAEDSQKLKNSPELAALKEKRKGLETAFKMNNPNSLVSKITALRNDLEINDSYVNGDDFFDEDEIEDFDDFMDDNSDSLPSKKEYMELCAHIGGIINETPAAVAEMAPTEMRKKLKLFAPELDEIKSALEEVKIEIGNETARVTGKEDITSIIFDIFDFEDDAVEEEPKEMLAAANVKYVRAIAYNMCRSRNMLNFLDDATAYGLIGLTKAINRWYNIQKFKDSAITFTGMANSFVAFEISRGLYALTSASSSGSTAANIVSKRNAQINNFIKNNPELKDLPKELVESMLETTLPQNTLNIISETDYTSMVGGSDGGDNADIWANKLVQEVDEFNVGVLDSLKALFSMFDMAEKPGIDKITKKPFFNKLDYKLFKLIFGLEFKREQVEGGVANVNYNQAEIGKILYDYARKNNLPIGKDGTSDKGISQPAVYNKIKVLKAKLAKAKELYPEIELGLQYIVMSEFSNALEDITNKYEQDMFISDYDLSNQRFANDLTGDRSLSDIVEEDEDRNLVDDEIADMFNDFE